MIKQDTKEWLDMRKNYIGASDSAILMNGVHFKKTPYMLWQEKLNLAQHDVDNVATRYGKQNEEPARIAYEKETGIVTVPEVVFHKKIDYLMASLDGINIGRDLVLEIKNPGEVDHATAKEGKAPDKYYAQVQAQLACSDADIAHYWSFRYGCGVLVEVKRDNKYIDRFYEKAEKFWECVLSFVPPEMNEFDYPDLRTNEEFNAEMDNLSIINAKMSDLAKQKEIGRRRVIEIAGKQSAQGQGNKLTRYFSKGSIDYSRIPELKEIDLDKYRKKPTESFRFSFS